MLTGKNKAVLVVTKPLHYAYFSQQYNIDAIGSTRGLIADCPNLNFRRLKLYDVPNTIESVTATDMNQGNKDRSYIGWRATNIAAKFLGNPYELAHKLEKKSYIRSVIPESAFPEFKILKVGQLNNIKFDLLVKELGSNNLVMQIDFSVSGKGTFFVTNQTEIATILPALVSSKQNIVVSRKIEGTPRALQCFAADGKVWATNWWHQDLVGIKGIYNPHQSVAGKYSGAILQNIPSDYIEQTKLIIRLVGDKLHELGYSGIFGIDIVVDEASRRIYLIEISPRFTAVSHVYATAMRSVGYDNDFLTAHVENLVGITGHNISVFGTPISLPNIYYYLRLQNILPVHARLMPPCKLGIYDYKGQYKRFGFGIDTLENKNEIAIIPEASRAAVLSPGTRMFSVIGIGNPLNQNRRLSNKIKHSLDQLKENFVETK